MPRKRDKHHFWGIWSDKKIDEKFDEDNIIEKCENDETFHIGQSYEEEAVTTIKCAKCGSREFNVGQGNYFTAIRCPKCKWELCIHNG